MKNIEKEYRIVEKQIESEKPIADGIAGFELYDDFKLNSISEKEYMEGEERYHFYNKTYIDTLKELKDEDFDQEFDKVYKLENVLIDDKPYQLKKIYIEKLEDGDVCLKIAGEADVDLITNKEFSSKVIDTCRFINTTAFYELYSNGKINSDGKVNGSELKEIILKWDGKMHDKTKELYAEKVARDTYREKYGS